MVELYWTVESKIWLKEIYDYIAMDSPDNAKEVINNIIQRAESIKEFPSIGQRLMDWTKYDVRMILYGHYRIVYHVKSERAVDILGVYHSALDLERHLRIPD